MMMDEKLFNVFQTWGNIVLARSRKKKLLD